MGKKPKAAAAAPPPKKEEKVMDNVQKLDKEHPTKFDLYNFKTFYVNHKDLAGEAVDEFYKQLDWDGWAFWHITYDIMDYEQTEKEHMLNNLLDGFMSRAGHTMKYTFGKLA